MITIENPPFSEWDKLLKRPESNNSGIEKTVKEIINDVKESGDDAVKKYTIRFDKAEISNIKVSNKEISDAIEYVDEKLKSAIKIAYDNIEKFHRQQFITKDEKIETSKGVICWKKTKPITKVGLYIPGGSAPLFSTVLMLGIPAKIAGCGEIVLCSPPMPDGSMHPAILFTASLVGITTIFKVGGVQAIAAMAYGTESIPKVYKIFGPGNSYVTLAKQIVSADVSIDMPAGPSEVAIIADETCDPEFVAADLLSQAEHGPDSQVLLVSTDATIASEIEKQLQLQTALLPRKNIALKALQNSKCIIVKDIETALQLINKYAPEHLILSVKDAEQYAEKIENAGSVFLGNYTPESAGDYASGTNHTLPTNGFARSCSGISVDDFVKKISFQSITKEGIKNLGPVVEIMAEAEGLQAHKNAVTVRLK